MLVQELIERLLFEHQIVHFIRERVKLSLVLLYVSLYILQKRHSEITTQEAFHAFVIELKHSLEGSIDLLWELKESSLVLLLDQSLKTLGGHRLYVAIKAHIWC